MGLLGGMYEGRSCLNLLRKCITASMPSLCGMFVYKDLTSAVTRIALGGRGGKVEIICSRCLVSLMCEGNFSANGCMKWVMYLLKLSVGPSQPETIGRSG